MSGEAALLPHAVNKSSFLDLVAKFTAAGLPPEQIPAKIEGMAFGEDVVIGGVVKHTLYVTNDNDFLATTPGGKTNPGRRSACTRPSAAGAARTSLCRTRGCPRR
jgi:hypothetical protein